MAGCPCRQAGTMRRLGGLADFHQIIDHAGAQRRIGIAGGLFQFGVVGVVADIWAGHQPKQRRMTHAKLDIGQHRRTQPVTRPHLPFHSGPTVGEQHAKPFGRHRHQQAELIAEMIKRRCLRHADITGRAAQAELPRSTALDQRQRARHHGRTQIAVVIGTGAIAGGRVFGGERRGRIDHEPREPSAVQPFYFSFRPIGIALVTPAKLALLITRRLRIGGAGPGLLFSTQQIFPQRRGGAFGPRQSTGFMRGQIRLAVGLWLRRTAV